jgi:hypothetical protein
VTTEQEKPQADRPVCYKCGAGPAGSCSKCGNFYCLEHGSWSDISAKGFCSHCLVRRNLLRGLYAIVFVGFCFLIIYWLMHL